MNTEATAPPGIHEANARLVVDMEEATVEGVERLIRDLTALPHSAPISLLVKTPLWKMSEQHSGPLAVAARLREVSRILSVPRGQLLHPPYAAQPIALESDVGNNISDAYRSLDTSRFTLSGDVIRALHRLDLWQHSIVLALGPDDAELTFRYIGGAHRKRFGSWAKTAIGRPFSYSDTANPSYSQWVSRYYQLAFNSGTPVRHVIDSLINRMQQADLPYRTNYDRLLAPLRLVDGRGGLLVVSQVTPGLLPLAPCSVQDPGAALSGSSKPEPSRSSPGSKS